MRLNVNRLMAPVALVISIALGNCAALMDTDRPHTYQDLQINLGSASTKAVEQRTFWVLQRYGFILVKQELSPTRIYFETAWQIRDAFVDEAQAGAVSAETRLLLRAGPLRGAASTKVTNRSVWLVAENRVHTGQGEIGLSPAYSDEFKAYIQEIAAALKSEYLRDSIF
ncbi:MAG: hypothetical protein IIA59_10540 [Candidatus Marinimicrobia bacterium]|nr:hypothetical protein [Candidatus Neomarinimicrobiota bacterium]